MLKQLRFRNSRSKRSKVKHVLQTCMVLAVCIWLLNHLRHYYDKKEGYEDVPVKALENVQNEFDVVKLGRKHINNPRVDLGKTDLDFETRDEVETEVEIDEIKSGDIDDEGRGGGDNETDGRDQETTEEEEPEEVEDLIDVDDREREEGSEDQEGDDKGSELDDADSLEDQGKSEDENKFREAREKHYTGDDASSSVLQQNSEALRSKLEVGVLRRLEERVMDAQELRELGREHSSYDIKEFAMDVSQSAEKLGNRSENGEYEIDRHGKVKGE